MFKQMCQYLNKDVREVGNDIVNACNRGVAVVAGTVTAIATGVASMVKAPLAHADAAALTTAAQTALTGASDSAWTVGGYVVGAIAVLVTIGIVVALLRKS